MVYGKAGRGAKFGGFSTFSDASPEDIGYDDEEVIGYELGFKSRLADGAAELNLALFLNDFSDLQVVSLLVSEAGARPTINNAATATTQGLELDGRWALSESLSLGAALAWLDAEYDSYPEAPCNSVNAQFSTGGGCDLSGQPLPFAPDFSGSIYADFVHPLTPGLNLLRVAAGGLAHGYPVRKTSPIDAILPACAGTTQSPKIPGIKPLPYPGPETAGHRGPRARGRDGKRGLYR